jgi:SAM-dependent methyltransferase
MSSANIDQANEAFWHELCGSSLARQLGVTQRDASSLARFDDGFLAFYPYLLQEIPVAAMRGLAVLEVGLGYGTLGQKLVEAGANYRGLDIAAGPVDMMNQRLRMLGREPTAVQGNVLHCPFPDASFDAVVSIGCFHHTGDVARAVQQTHRVLKPGGQAHIMVYNRFSYRNWIRWPGATWKSLGAGQAQPSSTAQRAAFDVGASGQAAPETAFLSIGELRTLFSGFSSLRTVKRNWGGLGIKGVTLIPRKPLLGLIGPLCGLDIYVSAVK